MLSPAETRSPFQWRHINHPMMLTSGNSSSHPVSFILLWDPRIGEFLAWGCLSILCHVCCGSSRQYHSPSCNPELTPPCMSPCTPFWPCCYHWPVLSTSTQPQNAGHILVSWSWDWIPCLPHPVVLHPCLFFSGVRIAHGYGPWTDMWLSASHCIILVSWPRLSWVNWGQAWDDREGWVGVESFLLHGVQDAPFCPSRIIPCVILWAHGCAEVGVRWH